MDAPKTSPTKCSTCQSAVLEKVTSAELFAAGIPPGWTTYRCAHGHFFMAEPSPNSKEK